MKGILKEIHMEFYRRSRESSRKSMAAHREPKGFLRKSIEPYQEIKSILKDIYMESYRKSKKSFRKSIWNPIGNQKKS